MVVLTAEMERYHRHGLRRRSPLAHIASLFGLFLLVAGCGGFLEAEQPTATPKGSMVAASAPSASGAGADPEVVFRALENVSELSLAAEQVADAAGTPAPEVRVRVMPSSCATCDAQNNAALGTLEGLPVEEASALVVEGGTLWIVVDSVTCEYTLEADLYIPQNCR